MDMKEKAKFVLDKIANDTRIPICSFKLLKEKTSVFDSKAGGLGYVPHNVDVPKDHKNRQLQLLAQINCSDVELENFPKSGILQFWILNNDICGADFDNNTNQDTFRIVYYSDIDKSVTSEEIENKSNPYVEDDYCFPVYGDYKLAFEKSNDSLSVMSDNNFCDGESLFVLEFNKMYPDEKIESIYDLDFDLDEVDDQIYDQNSGHKIGGYPYFTQFDPRSEGDSHDFLLFQLDSDYGDREDKVLWGDSGICNFFINSEKLKALDFSDVIYNWDCC